jgi:dolichol-phosphate mannosyltransferase
MRQVARPLVILPTFNEKANLPGLIPAILSVDSRLHVLVVDDNSPDGTADAVRELMATLEDRRLFLETRTGKLGLASAYLHGFSWALAAGYDFMIEMDADWSHQPKYLKEMLALALEFEFVIGSRYVAGGGTLHWGLARRLLSRFGSRYARWVLGVEIADFTGGFNGWHADVLRRVCIDSIRSEGYGFQIELKYRSAQLGFTHREFPIVFDERRAGKSKMSAAIAWEAVWRIWTFRASARTSDTQIELRQRHP